MSYLSNPTPPPIPPRYGRLLEYALTPMSVLTLHNKQIMDRAICLKYSNCFQIKLKMYKLNMGHIYVLFYANIIYLKSYHGTPYAPKYAEIISPKRHKDIVLGMFGPSALPSFSVTDFKRFQRNNVYISYTTPCAISYLCCIEVMGYHVGVHMHS